MGMFSVDFIFDCCSDDGTDLRGVRAQEMDAFIGYAGAGEIPPCLIKIDADRRVTCALTGRSFDPTEAGNEDTDSYPQVHDGQFRSRMIGLRVLGGKAVMVRLLDNEDEELPPC